MKYSKMLLLAGNALLLIAGIPDARCDGYGGSYFNPSHDHFINFGLMAGTAVASARLDDQSSPFSLTGGFVADTHLHDRYDRRILDGSGNIFFGKLKIVQDLNVDARLYLLNRSGDNFVEKDANGALSIPVGFKMNPDLLKAGGGVGGVLLLGKHQVALIALEMAWNALKVQQTRESSGRILTEPRAGFWFVNPDLKLRVKCESLANFLDLGLSALIGAGFPVNSPEENIAHFNTKYDRGKTSVAMTFSAELEFKIHFLQIFYGGALAQVDAARFTTVSSTRAFPSQDPVEKDQTKQTTIVHVGGVLGLSY